MDRYIQQYARQDFNRSLAIPYVFIDKQNPRTILGYYTLSNQSLDLKLLPNTISKNIPYPSVPTTLIGRLAIDKSYQGKGYGKILFVNALRQAMDASRIVASWAVVVDAKNEAAIQFYESFGFMAIENYPNRLFLPMDEIVIFFKNLDVSF